MYIAMVLYIYIVMKVLHIKVFLRKNNFYCGYKPKIKLTVVTTPGIIYLNRNKEILSVHKFYMQINNISGTQILNTFWNYDKTIKLAVCNWINL